MPRAETIEVHSATFVETRPSAGPVVTGRGRGARAPRTRGDGTSGRRRPVLDAPATLPGARQKALAQFPSGHLFPGDAAILRLLAAVEIIESDLWQQYNELAGVQGDNVPGGTGNPAFTQAVSILDGDMPQYIHD